MEKRIEVTLQNNVKSNVWFTVSNEEMSEKILSLSPSYIIVTDENTLCYSPDNSRTEPHLKYIQDNSASIHFYYSK